MDTFSKSSIQHLPNPSALAARMNGVNAMETSTKNDIVFHVASPVVADLVPLVHQIL
jgi:hypothetical protein